MPFDAEREGLDASGLEELKFCFSSQLLLPESTGSKAQATIRSKHEEAQKCMCNDEGKKGGYTGHTSWFTRTGTS